MSGIVSASRDEKAPFERGNRRQDVIERVASSATFQRSPRLRAFLQYVCRCALNDQPEAATEQQIGIHVFDRPPGYNPSEDNIVRSQARLLRWKLEQHFASDGKDEPLIITIPKGQYLPVFEERQLPSIAKALPSQPGGAPSLLPFATSRKGIYLMLLAGAGIVALVLASVWLVRLVVRSKTTPPAAAVAPTSSTLTAAPSDAQLPVPPAVATGEEVRIAAGLSGESFVDVWGRKWDADRSFQGGVAAQGPSNLFPPVSDTRLFHTLRQSVSANSEGPESKAVFSYGIPAPTGVYELRLYFADPKYQSEVEGREDAQNLRHFQVQVNGHTILWNFDPISDGAPSAVDIRAFRDVSPDRDGMIHLAFMPGPERPFVNAIELLPATTGRISPIRISAGQASASGGNGVRWQGDDYFIHGRTDSNSSADPAQQLPQFASGERFGNFSYAIPVPPGSYTVNLYFAESFFLPWVRNGLCTGGKGCRVFDVSCNGAPLLQDFDVSEAAGGPFRVLERTFHGLHPNGQGKLFLTFSSKVNYAEVRAIEVIDEAK